MTATSSRSPDDDCYAWLVVGTTFLANAIIYGVSWSVGVFLEPFADQFSTGSGVTALVTSLNTALLYGAGPISALLTNRFGYRRVAMLGGLTATAGLALSALANNVYHLLVTFGICTGFGFGLSYIPFSAIIGVQFDGRHRGLVALAFGIASAGTGAGSLVGGVTLRWLIGVYGWRGAALLAGGLCLHLCVLGAALRPPANVRRPGDGGGHEASKLAAADQEEDSRKCLSADDERNEIGINGDGVDVGNKFLYEIPVSKPPPEQTAVVSGHEHPSTSSPSSVGCRELLRLDIFTRRSYVLLCVNNVLLCFGLSIVYIHLVAYACSSGSGWDVERRRATAGGWKLQTAVEGVERRRREDDQRSVDESSVDGDAAALLLTAVGAANLAGRILFGVLACFRPLQVVPLYCLSLLLCGLTTCLCPTLTDRFHYPGLVAFSAAFGLTSACIGPLLPPIMISFLDADSLASAYGYLLVFEAVGQFFGAPVAGWLYDATGIYSASFYLAGAVLIVSALLMLLPWRWEATKSSRNEDGERRVAEKAI